MVKFLILQYRKYQIKLISIEKLYYKIEKITNFEKKTKKNQKEHLKQKVPRL